MLLDAGADPTRRAAWLGTPLHSAAEGNKNPEVVTTLIKAGADVNAKDQYGETPLHRASYRNGNPEIVTTLIKAGADVNAKNKAGKTPLDSNNLPYYMDDTKRDLAEFLRDPNSPSLRWTL